MSAPATGELTEQLRPDTGDLGRAARASGTSAHRARRSSRRAGAPRRPPTPAWRWASMPRRSHAAPAAVRAVDEVCHHDVAVQVWVAVPVDPVREPRRDHPRGRDHDAFAPDRRTAVTACLSRYVSAPATASACTADDLARRVRAPECEQHTGRFGSAEGQVEGRHGDPAGSEGLPGPGMPALEQVGRGPPARAGLRARARRPPRRPSSRRSGTGSSRARSDR